MFIKVEKENKVKEVPYVFKYRKKGHSKLGAKDVKAYLLQLIRLFKAKVK